MSLSKLIPTSLRLVPEKMDHQRYEPVAHDERHKARDSSGSSTSEEEAFLPEERLAAPARRSFLRRYGRIGLEAALLVASLTALAITVYHKPSLHQRQVECGRLLGQWRAFLSTNVQSPLMRTN